MINVIYYDKNIEIETFNILDNSKSIKDRIALKLDILPRYLIYDKEIDINTKNVKVINILKLIIESDSFQPVADLLKNNINRNILEDWILYNKNLVNNIEKLNINIDKIKIDDNHENSDIKNLFDYFSDIKDYENIISLKNFIEILKRKNIYIKSKELQKEKFIKNTQKETREYKNFTNIKEKISDEKIIKKGSTINIEFKQNIEIFDLFNKIILNERISFAKSNNFFKILKDFSINQEWLYENEDIDKTEIITVYIYIKKELNEYTNKDYIPVNIQILNNIIISTLSIQYTNENITLNEIAEELKKVLRIETSHNIKEQILRGSFNVYDSFINYHILAELAMNDNIMSKLIYIDESYKATKSRIFVYFKETVLDSVTVEISNHKKSPDDIKNEIFISGKDEKTLTYYKNIFVKICSYYEYKMEYINNMYKELLDDKDFGIILIEEEEEKHGMMRDIDKDIYVPGYVRKCGIQRRPQLIQEEELKNYNKDNYIKFPRDIPLSGVTYLSDGKKQKYYTCSNNEEYPYLGLQENNMENSKYYPYLPCCFKKSQQDIINKYYGNNIIETPYNIPSKQQKIIVTNKILSDNATGFLPSNINKLFSLLYQDNNYHFLRLGNRLSTRSFLLCVIKCLLKRKEKTSESVSKIINFLKNKDISDKLINDFIKNFITNSDNIYISRQNIYDKDIEQIKINITNPDLYFNPRLYIQLLEHIFEINIILFNENGFFSPRHYNYYYKFKKNNKCIFIYEHMGSESDRSKFPQCEIICRTGINKDSKLLDLEFDLQNINSDTYKISKNINILYTQFVPIKYLLNIFNTDKCKFISQIIDYYGKTRQLNIEYKNEYISIYTNPICPLNIKEEKSNLLYISELKKVLDFCKDLNIIITSQVIINNNLNELIGLWDNIEISIPIKDNTIIKLDNIPIKDKELNYFKQSNSYLEIYNNNQKIANYLLEHTYWLFSNYLHDNNKTNIQKSDFDYFSNNFFNINTNHKYTLNKDILFSDISDNIFINKKKLIVTSQEMIKKLMYSLRLFSIRNMKELKDYKNKFSIKKSYNYISDFIEYSNQIILYNIDSVFDWINKKSNIYIVYNSTDSNIKFLNYNEPYYINFNKHTFLAVNSKDLYKSLDISTTWNNDNYNKNIFSNTNKKFKNISYNLHIYVVDKFVLNKVNGGNPSINILIHRNNNDNIIYTSLLSL